MLPAANLHLELKQWAVEIFAVRIVNALVAYFLFIINSVNG